VAQEVLVLLLQLVGQALTMLAVAEAQTILPLLLLAVMVAVVMAVN